MRKSDASRIEKKIKWQKSKNVGVYLAGLESVRILVNEKCPMCKTNAHGAVRVLLFF